MTLDPSRTLKYALDRLVAASLLVVLAPFLGLIAAAICLDSRGGPLFLQERVGEGGRSFTIFKFRTMRQGTGSEGLGVTTAADDARITRVGRFLRASSLDELPQLLNIALGEMSFIGPRPTLRYQVDSYTPRQRRRLLFRPGITGWAQVHGRNEIPWSQRIELDLHYVEHFSPWMDLRILLKTLRVLLRGRGVYAASSVNDAFVVPPVETESHRAAPTAPVAPTPATSSSSASLLPLLVVGAGGHARVLIDMAEKQARYRVVGLLDEHPQLAGETVLGYRVLGGREQLGRETLPSHAIVAIGSAAGRAAWQEILEEMGFQLAVLVHPAAVVGRDVRLGAGTVLMAGAVVNSGSRLGRGVIVNTGASIDHDCEIDDFAHVAPGARLAGGVRVGARAHVGIGSCVIQNLRVGAEAVVGAGAAVIRPVPPRTTVVGVPARPLHQRSETSAPATTTASV